MDNALDITVTGRDAARELIAALDARKGSFEKGAKIRVLSMSLFRQRVALSRSQAQNLSMRDLENALFYEIEPFSGLSRAESVFAWVETASDDQSRAVYEVVQAPNVLVEELSRVAREAGCVFDGLSAVPEEGLSPGGSMPWIKPAAVKGSRGRAFKAYALLMVIALAAVAVHAWMSSSRVGVLSHEVASREPLQRELDALSRRIGAIEGERRAIKDGRERSIKAQSLVAALRQADADLLRSVASSWGDLAIVRSIVPVRDAANAGSGVSALQIEASALDAAKAMEAGSILQKRLSGRGWRVSPGTITEASGTVLFTLVCEFSIGGGEGG